MNTSSAPGQEPEQTVCPCCSSVWGDMRVPSLRTRTNRSRIIHNVNNHGGTCPPSSSSCDGKYNTEPESRGRANNYMDRGLGNKGSGSRVSDYNAASTGEGYQSSRNTAARQPGRSEGGRGGSRDAGPMCLCGAPKLLLTTTKPGPNQGRRFYTCPAGRDKQCRNSFEWEDGG